MLEIKYQHGLSLIEKQKNEKKKPRLNSLMNSFVTSEKEQEKIDIDITNFKINLSFPPRITKEHFGEMDEINKEAVSQLEESLFLEWIRNKKSMVFERNYEVWRQFFIGIEQSECIAQILDAQRIEFYLNLDIINEYPNKSHILLINKTDLLINNKEINYDSLELDSLIQNKETLKLIKEKTEYVFYSSDGRCNGLFNLINKFNKVALVGYPNVGKSSTMNLLIGRVKSGVNDVPGKTKHIQTYNFNNTLLIDTPGLVFAYHDKINLLLNNVIQSKYENWDKVIELVIKIIGEEKVRKILGGDILEITEKRGWSSKNLFEFLREKRVKAEI
ncbi:hypothetical protein H312_00416 [Anncaliia algerae PRA339]|uniref:G domain-containing protein n=1 Tax=Anncaliia algerae PRA339 TaxID=1288291 RepID=A0A059F584_9MICR|nr:hypothetical protein H312_00416 [Anncaliia algerae PRA339]